MRRRDPDASGKLGSECGIRLDQSQEPLAGTVSDTTGRAQRFHSAWKERSGSALSARQLFHSGLLITTTLVQIGYRETGHGGPQAGTNTNHSFDSLHGARKGEKSNNGNIKINKVCRESHIPFLC